MSIEIYKVGGCVRDLFLNKQPNDIDYVVVGATIQEMEQQGYQQVGADFPVFLHPQTRDEYALARKEIKTGDKHTDFKFDFNPKTTLREDLERRDFTMNAIAQNIQTQEIVDYFNGVEDIKNKIIRHINTEHFVEDPLRVLRAIRFATQLDFEIASETKDLCCSMVKQGMLQHLTEERIWKEIEKCLNTTRFDKFIQYLDEFGALNIIFPELQQLKTVPEIEQYHPEKWSYNHVLLTLKQVKNYHTKQLLPFINFGLLCHDMGKLKTQSTWPKHHCHDTLGLPIVEEICNRLKVPNAYKSAAILVCKFHMKLYEYEKSHIRTHYDFIKSITNQKDWKPLQLLLLCHKCDLNGRAGQIAQDRIDRCLRTEALIEQEFKILKDKSLKDLPKSVQDHLSKFKGQQFGALYRDAQIAYLKTHLNNFN